MKNLVRRSFLKNSLSACVAAGFSTVLCKNNPHIKSLKNIVLIIGDDHSARVLGCYGNTIIRTPNLDRMASQGVLFTHAFANAPMCSASRQSLLTGKYPHAAGVTLLRTSFPEEQYTVAEHLQKYGFKTGYVGKMHFNNGLPHGFEYRVERGDFFQHIRTNPPEKPAEKVEYRPPWKPFQDAARIWLNADMLPSEFYDKDDIGSWYAKKAIEFIQQNRENRFCLWVGFHEPHSPFNFPIEYRGKYNPKNMPLPEGSAEDDLWIPVVFKDLTENDRRGIIASYYTSVEYLDKNVGLIINELEKLGLSEKTLIVYIGDHGYLLNDHKRFEKHMMWEPAVGAPLIIRAGDLFSPATNRDVLCEFVDLAPTIMDIMGIDPMPESQGKSLLPVLKNKTAKHKDYIFSEFLADNKAMVRTKEWKYIFTTGKRDLGQGYATGRAPWGVTHRLYNLIFDPNETTDVSQAPDNQKILMDLKKTMIQHFKQTHPFASQLPADLNEDEILAWFCEPPDVGADVNAQ